MKSIILSIVGAFSMLFTSCSSTMTPFGRDLKVGTDTTGYVAASGGVTLTSPDGKTISASNLLIVDSENNSTSFREGIGLGKTISRWYFGMGAIKSLGNVAGKVLKAKEVTKQTESTNAAATAQNAANNAAATEQATIAAEAEQAALGAGTTP